MSEWLELSSSMTGSTDTGPRQPQKDISPVLARSSPFDLHSAPESPSRRGHRHRPPRKMTLTSANGQPIQLTPLWEHVVRTRKFPIEVDTRLTFLEIAERLRDPEWEVRQHALRVLIDVLPTLSADVVDKVMQPVVPELVNNLGHPAPAVRKGALDALRVFLIHSRDRENTIRKILQDGLNRSEIHDSFQTNVTTGVILSVPSLLFPSSSSPSPDVRLVKDATVALASRLAQVPHQEAVLKSLTKICDAVGTEEFESYLEDYDNKLKRNIQVLSKIYNIKSARKSQKKGDAKNLTKGKDSERKWDSDSDTSGIAEEEDEVSNAMPAARVVLETEIKFNEETAITMTILEEKEDSEKEQDEESGTDVRNDGDGKDSSPDRRKTPRRVHFGGEVVKLRTPDSDETESVEAAPKTRIPVPVSPARKMPVTRTRPSSQPCSPRRELGKLRRASRSVSSSPKREVYTHNAELSPKKSILARTSSPMLASRPVEQVKRRKSSGKLEDRGKEISRSEQSNELGKDAENSLRGIAVAGRTEEVKKEGVKLVQNIVTSASNNFDLEDKSLKTAKENKEKKETPLEAAASKVSSRADTESFSELRSAKEAKEERNQSSRERRSGAEVKSLESIPRKIVEEENPPSDDSLFGSLVKNDEVQPHGAIISSNDEERPLTKESKDAENEALERETVKLRSFETMKQSNVDREALRNDDGERSPRGGRDKAGVIEKNGSAARGAGEAGIVEEEPSWEELGLVDQEVLEDLHNKEDWRARVRGLERVASALRTSSALIAIEPRLGSLLHAVLGCERSCRVAAAGLAVAKVVVAGVSEEALKRRLPQLAWGLARQGGPSAAQLARVAMLRLRPALLLEQLLQPQCLNARNAKTRENTLQLLIFSLVTFPSTEFKVDTVANKVAKMVRDRRRRVRQAALDTLAVLAQIYESEEVLAAGKRASEGHHDGEAMISAIRARLARKSLPLVSADGLVMYGLQISPAVQIATGPDVDWIVAGSGSVSPGIGRTKGQIIATRSEKKGQLARNENAYENPWIERPNLVALGVAIRPKIDQPVVWQMVPTQRQDMQCEDEMNPPASRGANVDIRSGESSASGFNVKSRNQPRIPAAAKESTNYRNIVEDNFEQREMGGKVESRIPVLFARDRGPKTTEQDKSTLESINANSRRRFRDAGENTSRSNIQEEFVRSSGTMYRRKRNQQENSTSMHYDTYRSTKNSSNASAEYNDVLESTSEEFSDAGARVYQKYPEKDRFTKKPDTRSRYRSNSVESHQTLEQLPRSSQQQTFIMHDMYNASPHREGRFVDENSYRPLQTAPTLLSRAYNKIDFNERIAENNERSMSSRARFYRRTKDAAAQKINDVEVMSSDAQTNEHFPAICSGPPYRRRLRSLSPSQLYHRQQFLRMAPNEVHAMSIYDADKAVSEEEYNEKNKHHFLPEESYRVHSSSSAETRFEAILADDHELSSSDPLENNCQHGIEHDVRDTQDDSDSRSSSPDRPNVDSAFDVITGQSSPPHQDTVDFVISLNQKIESPAEPAVASIEDDASKGWSSEDEAKSRDQSRASSRNSEHSELREENANESEFSASDEIGRTEERANAGRRSAVSAVSVLTNEGLPASNEALNSDSPEVQASPSRRSSSPKKLSRSPSRSSIEFEALKSPRRDSRGSSHKLSFDLENKESTDSSEERPASSIAHCDNDSFESVEPSQSRRGSKTTESPTIIIASRPHSSEVPAYVEDHAEAVTQSIENDDDNGHRFISESNGSNNLEDGQSRDSSSETNTEPAILKIETEPVEPPSLPKRATSKVPRVTRRHRGNVGKVTPEKPEKLKPIVQQCFAQLESKEWEITMKGLKTLSEIAKQQPEYLDVCAAATISRLLGQQVKSLRSQVARAACLAAGDVFSSQIRGIDQDFDDIAGPLLHRTADTNRFLRADSNAALDLMIEHLPPHKTISVIYLRGASHQNAIVRAATARLLASIVDQIGPEHTLMLPKDVREKLLNTGARLLIDGNLDARNHAKRMFRCLAGSEGFRKALTDAVPETTLRHIDKTLKTL